MKRFDFGDLIMFMFGLVLTMIAFLGCLYLIGYMIELIANNLNPVVITAVCVIMVTIFINAVYDNKI